MPFRCSLTAILILRLRMLRDLWQDLANILTFYQTAFIGGTLTGCTAAMITLLDGRAAHQRKVRLCSSMTGQCHAACTTPYGGKCSKRRLLSPRGSFFQVLLSTV